MDPKTASSLDPKLKEVYDRVMGTANPQSSPPPQTTPQLSATPMTTFTKPADPTLSPQSSSPASTPTQKMEEKPFGTNVSPQTPPTSSSPFGKPTVDYAALAAKYATPTPTINNVAGVPHQTPVTPSSTTYGVVNNKPARSEKEKKVESGGSSTKKILFIVGFPIFLLAYSAVWIFIFQVDIFAFLPLP